MSNCNSQDPTCNKHSDHLQYGYQDRLQYDYQDQLEVVRNRERAWAWTHAAEQLRISHAGHPWLCSMPRYAKAPCQIKGSSESSEIEKSRARVLTSVLISGFTPSKRNSPIGDHPPKYAWNWTIYIYISYQFISYISWTIWKAPGLRVLSLADPGENFCTKFLTISGLHLLTDFTGGSQLSSCGDCD